jgi:hypothetical protein
LILEKNIGTIPQKKVMQFERWKRTGFPAWRSR